MSARLRCTSAGMCSQGASADLAYRAFRRPPQPKEIDGLERLFEDRPRHGRRLASSRACRVVLQAVLVSPHFLFRVERDRNPLDADSSHQSTTSSWRRGSRTSCGAACPTRSCSNGRRIGHASPKGRARGAGPADARTTRRPRRWPRTSPASGCSFGTSTKLKPDPDKFPAFDDALRPAMKRETELFFEAVVREDRSILDFLDANFTFLNERLAEHYGISGRRRARVPPCRADRRSARRRPDAGQRADGHVQPDAHLAGEARQVDPREPARTLRRRRRRRALPNLDEEAVGNTGSLRQQLEKHRTNPICASCHSAHGSARLRPRELRRHRRLADEGRQVRHRLRRVAAEREVVHGARRAEDDPARPTKTNSLKCLTEKMLTYALGRGLERYDRPAVQSIARRTGGGRVSFLVAGDEHRREHAVPDAPRRRTEIMITRKHLPRRTFLRGLGTAIALPVLDAMMPAFAVAGARSLNAPLRMAFAYVPERHHHEGLDARRRQAPTSSCPRSSSRSSSTRTRCCCSPA